MNTVSRLLALVLLAAALLACNPTAGDGTQTPTTALEGTEWELVALDGQAPLEGTAITATFAEGQIAGSSGCNSYFGSYTLRGSALQVQGLGGTEMACFDPEGVMDQEQTFLSRLGEVASCRLADDQLILRDAQRNEVLIFAPVEPVPDAELESTAWALTTFIDSDVASSLISGTAITLLLAHGTGRGSAGCNDYGGKYTLQPGILEIPEIDITEQRCLEPPGIMEQETQYIALLESVTTFELDGSQLFLRTNGDRGLVFVAQAPPTATQASPEPSAEQAVQEALMRYFSLLSNGQYSQAVELYGGDYDTLTEWNPDIDPSDHAGLLERVCLMNGLQCLVVHEILTTERIGEDSYRFTVQFENPDGSLFVRGPCRGATEEEMPPQSDFVFTVVRQGEGFAVQELPVYVP
jgi:heat shock protein HslJ